MAPIDNNEEIIIEEEIEEEMLEEVEEEKVTELWTDRDSVSLH